MATSAIGPGFLTQTAQFTQELGSSFACALLLSVGMSLIAQLNVWRILVITQKRGDEIASALLPGLGGVLTFIICFGGLVFNVGNIGGVALGLQILAGLNLKAGALLGAFLGMVIFFSKRAGALMDKLAQVLGALVILLVGYIAFSTSPPLAQAAKEAILPSQFSILAVLTLSGGTVGGYIIFAGGHRLLDAGVKSDLKQVDTSAYLGIGIATLVRLLLFLAILGVLYAGHTLDKNDPAGSAFKIAAGEWGYKIFGMVFVAASLTSVVGAAYTSVSFLKGFIFVQRHENGCIIGFIVISTLLFMLIQKPVALLIIAGALNGLILPLSLTLVLIAGYKTNLVGSYKHPKILSGLGALVVLFSAYLGGLSLTHLGSVF